MRLDNLVNIKRETSPSRIDRLDRERQVSMRASVAPGFALADRIEALRGAVDGDESAGCLHHHGFRPGARTGTNVYGIHLGVHPLDHFHVHDPGSQFESTVHPVTILLSLPLSIPFRAALAVGHRRHAESLFGAGHPGAVWRGEEELDSADRSHEQPARKGMERYEAIMQGNRDRLRPILMTTLALVAGMLPLALGHRPRR